MAIRSKNKPENQFPANFVRKNFGKAANKQLFVPRSPPQLSALMK